jgi:ArsR family transcriptional regulator
MTVDTNQKNTAPPAAADASCCVRVPVMPLGREEAQARAELLKAVADPARLQIISMLRQAPDRAACVCDLTAALALRQSTVSHHLRVLTAAGLVTASKRGYWTWYALDPQQLAEVAAVLR